MSDNTDNRSPGQKAYDDAQEARERQQLSEVWERIEKERQVSEELGRAIGKTIQGH